MPRRPTDIALSRNIASHPIGTGVAENAAPSQQPVYARVFPPGLLVLCPFADHDVLCDPADDKIAATLISGRPYQRRHIDAALMILEQSGRLAPGGLFLDIGANIGTTTLYAMRSGRFSGAIAFEPEPHNHAILVRNIALNGLSGEVETIAAAAGAEAAEARLNIAARNRGAHSLAPLVRATGAGRTIDVRVTTADLALAQSRAQAVAQSRAQSLVTLVKIDVEGHELAVLEGMTSLLGFGVPLLVEVTCLPAEQATDRIAALRARLGSCYRTVVDLERATPESLPESVALDRFTASAPQHDLLIF